jgi:hypothetical protein
MQPYIQANHPASGNASVALACHFGRHCLAVPEPGC